MDKKGIGSFVIGFLLLFFIYHFPDFFSAFWITAVFKIGFLLVAFILARVQGWKGLAGYGLGLKTGCYANLCKGLLIGLLFYGLSFFVSCKLGYEEIIEMAPFKNILTQVPIILFMTAIPSVAEDILTRGYIYAHFKLSNPFGWALLSSSIYVLNHIWRLNDGPAVITYLFILGIVLAFAVWSTKSLWLAFGIHWGANIAFESSHSIIQTRVLIQNDVPTWILAATWALLLAILVIFNKEKYKESVFGRNQG